MAKAAREYLHPQFRERVQVVGADLLSLPFTAAFDGIVSTAAFHWVLDHNRLFRGLFQSLRPGGWLQAQCGGGQNLARLNQRMASLQNLLHSWPTSLGPGFIRTRKELGDTLKRAGFVEIKTSLEAAPTIFEDRGHYMEFVKTVIVRTHLDRLPDASLRQQYLSNLADQAANDDPPFLLDYWRLNLSAGKP
jgi:trans-aconitate 2-methyltransferase